MLSIDLFQGSIARQDYPRFQPSLRVNSNSIQRRDNYYQDRIRNIKKILKRQEKVYAVSLQPCMLPAGSYLIPNIVCVDDFVGGRIIIP